MSLDATQARIFGSDDDRVHIGPLGTTLPTDLVSPLDSALTDAGWLHSDGVAFQPSDTLSRFRGHQGAAIIRTKITESGTGFQFQCLETMALTLGLQHNVKSSATSLGVSTVVMGSNRKVLARAFVLDMFDADDTSLHYRFLVPRGEIGERQEFTLANSDITGYTFPVEIIGDYTLITNDPAFNYV